MQNNMGTLAEHIAEFLKRDGFWCGDEIDNFQGLKIEDAIKKAVLVFDERGKLFIHRWNLKHKPKIPLETEAILLKSVAEIQACKDFDELHELIKSKILPIPFVGELYCYDTAFKIGISMGIYPQRIYLHADTRKGAVSLGLYKKGKEVLEKSDLLKRYPEFENMEAYQIEDFLCIKEKAGILKRFKRP
jgi:hypothetical protein